MDDDFPPVGSSPAQFDPRGQLAKPTDTLLPWRWDPAWTPAVQTAADGYTYDVTSPWWKELCRRLPSMVWVDWLGYATATTVADIGGESVVIQCWKGWCQQFTPGVQIPGFVFPGGIGAEVALYTYEKPPEDGPFAWQAEALALPGWPGAVLTALREWKDRLTVDAASPDRLKQFWPASEAIVQKAGTVTSSLHAPGIATPLVEHESNTYWTCKWMTKPSFDSWLTTNAPGSEVSGLMASEDYELRFTVAGVDYVWAASSSQIQVVPS